MLVEQGGKVVLADINAEAGAAKAAERSAQARFVRADIASEADGRQAVAATLEAFGGLHGRPMRGRGAGREVLGRNGIHALESFRRVIDINLVGSFNMLRLAAEAMSQEPAGRGRRARGDRQYRLGGGVRRADRPGRLFRLRAGWSA